MDKLLSLTEGFGDAVNQAVAHQLQISAVRSIRFGGTVNQVVMQKEQRKGQRSACF